MPSVCADTQKNHGVCLVTEQAGLGHRSLSGDVNRRYGAIYATVPNMLIGLLTVELLIESANSLKDKRQVLKSLIAHLRQDFNISVAEVDHHDLWRRATIGIAVVANDSGFADQVMGKVSDHIQSDPRVVLAQIQTELL